jgi:hypothetical protein
MFLGKAGRPRFLDFQRQNPRKAVLCQRMNVSGLTITNALRQSKNFPRTTITNRVTGVVRLSVDFRSW